LPFQVVDIDAYIAVMGTPEFDRNEIAIKSAITELPEVYTTQLSNRLFTTYIDENSGSDLRSNIELVAPILWRGLTRDLKMQVVRRVDQVMKDGNAVKTKYAFKFVRLVRANGFLSGNARIIRKYGLNEEDLCLTGETPAEYDQALRQLHDAWGALLASKMEEFGESEMARMFRSDRKQFAQTSEAGRQFFFGPEYGDDEEDLEWLVNLQDAVAACVEAESPMGPLGLSYGEEDGFWEIAIYPTPVELVGGADDGAVVTPGFSLDLEQLRSAFDSIAAIGWNALGLNYSEGPHVYVEGVYEGRDIFLQVLAYAPEDEDPGLKLNVS
jgi:hypothetical protein